MLTKAETRILSVLEKYLAKGYDLVNQTINSITLRKNTSIMKFVIVKR